MLAGIIDCIDKEEEFINMCRSQVISLRHFLVLAHPIATMNVCVQSPSKSKITKGSDSLGMKVWVTPSGEPPRFGEVIAEDEGK